MNPKELSQRCLEFSVTILELIDTLPYTTSNKVITNQLARSASSIGANYEEAQSASSKRDFIHKLNIIRKEAKETRYWLQILKRRQCLENHSGLLDEVDQLYRIFNSSKLTAEQNLKRKN